MIKKDHSEEDEPKEWDKFSQVKSRRKLAPGRFCSSRQLLQPSILEHSCKPKAPAHPCTRLRGLMWLLQLQMSFSDPGSQEVPRKPGHWPTRFQPVPMATGSSHVPDSTSVAPVLSPTPAHPQAFGPTMCKTSSCRHNLQVSFWGPKAKANSGSSRSRLVLDPSQSSCPQAPSQLSQ